MRRILIVGAVSMVISYAVIAYQLRTQILGGYSDFISFYTAGQILRQGAVDRLYDLNLQYEIQKKSAPNVSIRAAALPYVRPAFEAWIFAPIANLSYRTAMAIWSAISIVVVVIFSLLARRDLPGINAVPVSLIILVLLSYFPVFITLIQGQDALLLLLVFFLAYTALRKKKEAIAGMVLGLGIFKFTLVIPFLIPFLIVRRFRLLWAFCLTTLLLLGFSAWTSGFQSLAAYPQYLLSVDKLARGINEPRDMPNIRGLVNVLCGPHFPLITRNIVVGLLSLSLLAWLATKRHIFIPSDTTMFALAYSLNLVVTILVSYHAHVFDLVILVPFLALASAIILSDTSLPSSARKTLLITVACVLFSPLYLVLSLSMRKTALLALLFFGVAFALSRVIADVHRETCLDQVGSPSMALRP